MQSSQSVLMFSIGDMHNRQAVTPKRLWNALRDYDLWPMYLLGLLVFTPMVPMSTYITLLLRSIGFDTVRLLPLSVILHRCTNREHSSLQIS